MRKQSSKYSEKLSILMVINNFYPNIGGMQNAAQRLAVELTKKGVNVCVLTPRYSGLKTNELVKGIPVKRFKIAGSPHTKYGFYSKLVYAISLFRYLISHRLDFDIIHVHQSLYAAFICVIISKIIRKKIIIKVAGSGVNGNMELLEKLFFGGNWMLKIIRFADIFISLSPESTREMLQREINCRKIREIPNGIDLREYGLDYCKDKLKKRFSFMKESFIGMYIGRFGIQKHPDLLLTAWANVIKRNRSATLLLAGDGPDYSKLVDLTQKLKITDQVRFLGTLNNVKDYLMSSDVLILPSDSEGMSNSLLEAMALGIPCIASDVEGNANLIKDGRNGLLFNLRDTDELTDKILFVMNNRDIARRFAEKAREDVEKNYDLELVSAEYIKLYRELLNSRAG